jgi:pimeloyl-ACP methyl ester carboxylesterase
VKQSILNFRLYLIALCLLPLTATAKATTADSSSPAFEVSVTGSGQPIFLIPGLSSSGQVWNETVEHLAGRYECHVFTLAGFAGTPPLDQVKAGVLETYKQALRQYIKAHSQPGEAILMGHSLGGFLSLQLAQADADQFERVIIVDALPFLAAAGNPNATEAQMKQMPREPMLQQFINMDPAPFKQQQKATLATMMKDSARIQQALTWSLQTDRATMVHAMLDMMQTDLRDELSNITIPATILAAGEVGRRPGMPRITTDQIGQMYRQQYEQAPKATVLVAPSARHFIMWDNTRWFLHTLDEILSSTSSSI